MKQYIKSTSDTSKVLYEIECQRFGVTPREFYSYCNKRFKAKTGNFLDMWVDYDYWADESHNYYNLTKHQDWDVPAIESITEKPYEIHLYLANAYNFIMEFEFSDDNHGNGYMYVKEMER